MIRQNKILFSFFTVAAVLSLFLCFHLNGTAQNEIKPITQLNFNQNSNMSSLSISDIERLAQRISMNKVSFCSELDTTVVKGESVLPVLTNEYFFENYDNLIYGNGFTPNMIIDKRRSVVISDKLALRLFLNTNAVDEKITLNEETYTVIGVYQKSNGFLGEISKDDKERIYIPYTCDERYQYCRVDMLTYDNSSPSATLLEMMNFDSYYSVDFSEKSRVLLNFPDIANFVLFASLVIVVMKVWYRVNSRLLTSIKSDMQGLYFTSILKSKWWKILLFLVLAFGLPLLLIWLFILCGFEIYIVSQYIPTENIFDVSYYLDMIIKNAQTSNALALSGDTYLINLYSNTFNLLLWITAVFILSFSAWFCFVLKQANALLRKIYAK